MKNDVRFKSPVRESITALASESFVWRRDDYPCRLATWNTHEECELHLLNHSEGTYYIGDSIGQFKSGDLFLIGSNLPHNWVSAVGEGEAIKQRDTVLQFAEDRIGLVAEILPELAELKPMLRHARRGIVFHGEARNKGAALLADIGDNTGLPRLSKFLELMGILSRTKQFTVLSSTDFQTRVNDRDSRILADAFDHLSRNFASDVRLSDLARLAGMTETSFSRFLLAKTGNTFSHHLSQLRTARACELLIQTDLPVVTISGEAGYGNLSNFNRAFKLIRGMAPSRYRRLARSGPSQNKI